MRERPISAVPRLVLVGLALALGAQVAASICLGAPRAKAEDLPTAPAANALRLVALGEPVALAKLLMLWLQAFDFRTGTNVPYRDLDYARVEAWLDRILTLDRHGQYPLLSASRLYAEVPDPAKQRRMLEFVHRKYLEDPERRWPWLAHAAVIAKHRLKDLPLARRYAVSLQQNTQSAEVPMWVTQMEVFILEDLDEVEAAKVLLGGLIASGRIRDPRELERLQRRLEGMGERPRK
jgi:hypothetical protein